MFEIFPWKGGVKSTGSFTFFSKLQAANHTFWLCLTVTVSNVQ